MARSPDVPSRRDRSAGRSRTGQILTVAVVLVTILGILVYALHRAMLDFHAQSHKLMANLAVQQLALSGLAATASALRAAIGSGTDLGKRLLAQDCEGPLQVDIEAAKELILRDYPGGQVDVTVSVGRAQNLRGRPPGDPDEIKRLRESRGWDPQERRLPITMVAHARIASSEETIRVVYQAAVVSLSPGTLGKFTLWAENLVPADAKGFAGGVDGLPTGAGDPSRKPFVLQNGAERDFGNDPDSYKRRGYVYLGGEPHLDVSAGFTSLGELWTFLPIEKVQNVESNNPTLPTLANADPPVFFLDDHPGMGGPPLRPYRFEIRSAVTGFYSGPDASGQTLAGLFPAEVPGPNSPPLGRSSLLHLYGTAAAPSPTLVLGQVHRRYPMVGAVLVDATEDSIMDGLVTLLPQQGGGPFPQGLPQIPPSIKGLPTGSIPGTTIPLDNQHEVTWQSMFPEGNQYAKFGSWIEDRPYLEAYSFLFRSDDASLSFYPSAPVFPGFVEDLELTRDGNRFYRGEPRNLKVADILEKSTYAVATPDDLIGRFVSRPAGQRGKLSLGAVVEVERAPGGKLRLSGLKVTHGGVLILKGPGDIELDDVEFQNDIDFPLVLVALDGNVKLRPGRDSDNPIPVSVVAPAGKLMNLPGSERDPLVMEGSIVARTLDLDQFPAGGSLYHETLLDPTCGPAQEPYRLLLSDAPVAW